MRYQFPIISEISDVEPFLNDNFYVADKGDYKVVNYRVMTQETFPPLDTPGAAILRECRGLLFSKSGKIAARRYHKFFNLNERPEVFETALHDKDEMAAYEKLDGSMVSPAYLDDGRIIITTKNGETDVSKQAEEFITKNPKYTAFMYEMRKHDLTPIFEWCSRKQKIVVDHPEDKLVLLDVRDMFFGNYCPRSSLLIWSGKYDIPLVRKFNGSADEIRFRLKDASDTEGVVLQYPDGHRVKVKTDWYVQLHRAKDSVTRLRDVVLLILDQKIDDLKPLLDVDAVSHVEQLELKLMEGIKEAASKLRDMHAKALQKSRKEFALEDAPQNRSLAAFIFKALDAAEHPDIGWEAILMSSVEKLPVSNTSFKERLEMILSKDFTWKETVE